jgi:glycosyltransferase involved in cell wall biosynthesis
MVRSKRAEGKSGGRNGDARGRERPTVLFICHNHPSVRPGGAEAYALELHRHMLASGEVESYFLAKGGPPLSTAGNAHLGTTIAPAGRHPNEYFCFTEEWGYDWTMGTVPHDKRLYTKHLREFFRAIRPDVVHVQHTMHFGYDVLREIKNSIPNAPIFYTLHEFMPICHRQGQMVRTMDDEPCMEESPRRCHECFPEISQQTFFMRKKFIQSHLSVVDRFIAPSKFLGERYVDWGIPAEKVIVEEYGRTPPPGEAIHEERPFRDRFGFFGQVSMYKGLEVLLEAMAILGTESGDSDPLVRAVEAAAGSTRGGDPHEGPKPHARIHGANLDLQPGKFQTRIRELLAETKGSVKWVGKYQHDDLASHISQVDWVIVPSIWWENSPLVIQEAFHFDRPIICSDIGGMAEKVENGVNGLHFRANDATSLAAVIERAARDPALWERLREGIRPVYRMDSHVGELLRLYRDQAREAVTYAG